MKKQRTEIEFEQHEILIIRNLKERDLLNCPSCLKSVPLVLAEEAAEILSVSRREIYRLVESGCIHFIETDDGKVRVCLASLLNANTADDGTHLTA